MAAASKNHKQMSKFLSLVLRHNPSAASISLDSNGWARVDELISGCVKSGKRGFDMTQLMEIVASDEKGRYAFNEDKTKIRANQGHSLSVDLQLKPISPPDVLYHGTATRFLSSILQKGLIPGSRTHVHLSGDIVTAATVGKRHGKPVILVLDTKAMADHGVPFYRSENGVWLVSNVPPQFLRVMEDTHE